MKERYLFLLGYLDKQINIAERLYNEVRGLNLDKYENRYVFSLKTQQLFTALEDLFKQIANVFENEIEDLSTYHKALLKRMNIEITGIRPAVISDSSLLLLDRLRAFRHFIRHAYDYELDTDELRLLQKKIKEKFEQVLYDLSNFKSFLKKVIENYEE